MTTRLKMIRKEIVEYLTSLSLEIGRKEVESACKEFLKAPMRKSSMSTKRQKIPDDWIIDAWVNQNGVCARCDIFLDKDEAVGDHKIPILLGGPHTKENIAALHPKCNSSKGGNDIVTESKKSGRLFTDILK